MRSLYFQDLDQHSLAVGSVYSVVDKNKLHHLANVVRVKVGEGLLLLDGKGKKYYTSILEVQKREIKVQVNDIKCCSQLLNIDLGIGLLKKESMEEVIKVAVEIGFRNLIPITSNFSNSLLVIQDRMTRLIESALIQSNNPFFLNIKNKLSLSDLPVRDYDFIFYFCSQVTKEQQESPIEIQSDNTILILIGPEGGMSNEEEIFLSQIPNLRKIHLPTYVLRAPHAVSTATGYVLALWSNNRP